MFLLPLIEFPLSAFFHRGIGFGEPSGIIAAGSKIKLVLAHGGAEVGVVAHEVLGELAVRGEVDVVREKVGDLLLVFGGEESLKLGLGEFSL